MSLAALSVQLTELAQARPYDGPSRLRTLGACFHLFEHLTHPQNKTHLLAALLDSQSFWDGEQDVFNVAYDVCAAGSLLSVDGAYALAPIARHLCRTVSVPAWRKAVLLASILSAELREADAPPKIYQFWSGRCARPCVDALNAAMLVGHPAQHAACWVAYSYVADKLTDYQRSLLTSKTKLRLLESLFVSNLAFGDAASRGRKELGLLTRLLSSAITQDSFTDHFEASRCLLQFSVSIQKMPPLAQKQAFLSIILLQQALIHSFLLQKPALLPSVKHAPEADYAILCLQICEHLQGIHPDNAAFEPWRFTFGGSFDLLAQKPAALQSYLDGMPNDARWRLLVLESAVADLPDSSPTIPKAFNEAMQGLSHDTDKGLLELRHSVCLSLLLAFPHKLQTRIPVYLERVSADWQRMTERQVRLIFLSLYQLSLKQQAESLQPDAQLQEDVFGILRFIKEKEKLATTDQQKVLLLAYLDLLPFIPVHAFSKHLRQAAGRVEVADQMCKKRFAEVCTTEMDSERAMAVVRWRLGPQQQSML
jgi:hypothetical protein